MSRRASAAIVDKSPPAGPEPQYRPSATDERLQKDESPPNSRAKLTSFRDPSLVGIVPVCGKINGDSLLLLLLVL